LSSFEPEGGRTPRGGALIQTSRDDDLRMADGGRWTWSFGPADEALTRVLILLAIGALWLRPIGSSFWLDELGTYWVVRDGFGDMVRLALRYQGQSPLYYLVAWAARIVGDGSEVIMRLPSLAAAALATYVLARLARRLFGPRGAWASAVAFAVTPIVAFSAIDARPYAFAYLALSLATVGLVNLSERGDPRWGAAYGASVAGTVHFHYLFAFALLGHLPYLASRWPRMDPSARRGLWLAGGTAAVLLLPLAPQVRYLVEHARIPDLPLGRPSFATFLDTLIPVPVLAAALLGVFVAWWTGALELRARAQREGLLLAAGLSLAPSVGLLLFSVFSGINLLWETYTRSSAVGAALLLGGAIAAIGPARAYRIVLLVTVIFALLTTGGRWHSDQDWRGAAAEVNALVHDPSTPVLMHAAFIEGAHVEFFDDPEHRSQLLAQLSRYPVEGSVVPVPYNLTGESERYLENVVVPKVTASDGFVLVTLEPIAPFAEWLQARLGPLGFESRQVGEHGAVRVTVFQRGGSLRSAVQPTTGAMPA